MGSGDGEGWRRRVERGEGWNETEQHTDQQARRDRSPC